MKKCELWVLSVGVRLAGYKTRDSSLALLMKFLSFSCLWFHFVTILAPQGCFFLTSKKRYTHFPTLSRNELASEFFFFFLCLQVCFITRFACDPCFNYKVYLLYCMQYVGIVIWLVLFEGFGDIHT